MCFNFTAVFDFMLHGILFLHSMLVVVEKEKNQETEVGEPLE